MLGLPPGRYQNTFAPGLTLCELVKNSLSAILLLCLPISVMAQNNDSSAMKKIAIESALVLDNIYNMHGGIKTGYAALGLFDFSIYYAPAHRGMLKNTRFHFHTLQAFGRAASENLIGDLQVASNIEGRNARFLYELQIEQQIKRLNLTFGLSDLNSKFMVSEYAGNFINSSFGIFPTVSVNVPVPIFPVTSVGGTASYSTKQVEIAAGIYNLNHEYVEEEKFRFENHFFQKGYLAVTEFTFRKNWSDRLPASYKIGAFYEHCGHTDSPPGEEQKFGLYFIGDQALYKKANGTAVSAFWQIGLTPQKINIAPQSYGFGLLLDCPGRRFSPNQMGLAYTRVNLNADNLPEQDMISDHETSVELFYKKNLTPSIRVQPEMQYIIAPSGTYQNALVALLRLEIALHN